MADRSRFDYMEKSVTCKSYTLLDEEGNWLAQVVLTSDGLFASVTDYGNLSYAWRHFGDDFRKFIISINTHYFASKLANGLAYIAHSKTISKACERYAEMILPELQRILKGEIETEAADALFSNQPSTT